jgi:transposase
MEHFVGLDVSQEVTHICVVNGDGKIIWQGTCGSTPESIASAIRARARKVVRIGLESGMLSTWHWHALNDMGLPVVCLDARHAKAALSMQMNKTDKNDAHGLAQIIRTGWYREVSVKSLDSHTVRAMLGARYQLVCMRTDLRNQIRGILKTFGVVLGKSRNLSFDRQVGELSCGDGILKEAVRALLAVLQNVGEQILKLDRMVRRYTRQNKVCRRLRTVPGIGMLTATAFVAAIDDPERFRKSKSVGAFLGLTPRRYQSGETDLNGRISKCGDAMTRTYLFEAATSLMTKVRKWSALKAWGMRIAKRAGMKKARVAVARKLAVIMHRIWLTGETFQWSVSESEPGHVS